MPKRRQLEVRTIDMAKEGILLPPTPDKCQSCAVVHHPAQAHNAQSMFYQYWFYNQHGRWPTWVEAIAHCTPELRAQWERQLRSMRAWPGPNPKGPEEPQFSVGNRVQVARVLDGITSTELIWMVGVVVEVDTVSPTQHNYDVRLDETGGVHYLNEQMLEPEPYAAP